MFNFDNMIKEIIKNYDDEVEKVLKKSLNKQIIIFGAGQLGHKVYHILKDEGITVRCFCDNKTGGQKDVQTELEIVKIEELRLDLEHLLILIAVFDDTAYDIVYQQLRDFGFRVEQLMNSKNIVERLTVSYLEQNMEKYRKVYALLEDDYSRKVYLNRVKKAYLDQDISQIVSNSEEIYFDKEILLTEEEVFVDCGGFDGDTALRFVNRTNGKFKKIIIFEPEKSKEKLIKKNLISYNYDFYGCGLWSSDAILKFDARGDCASSVYAFGNEEINVKTLDGAIYEDAPTYIKMDIEGSELEALKGCRRIIKSYRPKLAISIYHKPEDLFEIPILIKEMNPDYRLIIRQYANSKFETVCYAI